MADQDVRSFVAAYERAHLGEVIPVTDPLTLEEDVMALVLEYERRGPYPAPRGSRRRGTRHSGQHGRQ